LLAFSPDKWLVRAGQWAAHVFPDMPFHTSLNPALISRDDDVVRAYINDPLVHDTLSAELAAALIQRGEKLLEYIESVDVPLLIMHGSEDHITSPTASATMAAALSGDVTYKMWQGLYHEIHNEPQKEEVFRYTLRWILNHLPTHGS
jgi:alpha-beta hydrolase superfamily lysophospholipase